MTFGAFYVALGLLGVASTMVLVGVWPGDSHIGMPEVYVPLVKLAIVCLAVSVAINGVRIGNDGTKPQE